MNRPEPFADHPHTDPGDGRTECQTCGKWVFECIHSCKGVPVTQAAWDRMSRGPGAVEPKAPAPGRGVPTPDSGRVQRSQNSLADDHGQPIGEHPELAGVARVETPADPRLLPIRIPSVAYKARGVTDAIAFRKAAQNLDNGYPVGGGCISAAVAALLRNAAAALDKSGHPDPESSFYDHQRTAQRRRLMFSEPSEVHANDADEARTPMWSEPNEIHHQEREESRSALYAMTEWDYAACEPWDKPTRSDLGDEMRMEYGGEG